MGKKVNPKSLRVGITDTWSSRWFGGKEYAKNLRQDVQIRSFILEEWKKASISNVEVERFNNKIRIVIYTSRPGILIGRGGSGIEDLSRIIKNKFFRNRKIELDIDIREIKQFEENAALVAQNVAEQLEKRMPFKRVMKSMIDRAKKNRIIKGIKIEISGRLGGADMSRTEWISEGTIPLQTLRANIDYATYTARTTYGAIGIKVWLYKGEVFDNR